MKIKRVYKYSLEHISFGVLLGHRRFPVYEAWIPLLCFSSLPLWSACTCPHHLLHPYRADRVNSSPWNLPWNLAWNWIWTSFFCFYFCRCAKYSRTVCQISFFFQLSVITYHNTYRLGFQMITNLFPEVLSFHCVLQYLPKHWINNISQLIIVIAPPCCEILSYIWKVTLEVSCRFLFGAVSWHLLGMEIYHTLIS